MKKKSSNKDVIKDAVIKMVSDKELVRAYMKGEISREELKKKGISFAKPL